MEKLNEYLQALVASAALELRLEPNRTPYIIGTAGEKDVDAAPIQGTQISMMVFPLIPEDVKRELPSQPQIEFVHPHNLGNFNFSVQKSPAGFIVTVRPLTARTAAAANDNTQPFDFLAKAAGKAIETPIEAVPEPPPAAAVPVTATAASPAAAPEMFVPEVQPAEFIPAAVTFESEPAAAAVPETASAGNDTFRVRMEDLFRRMHDAGASDLHMSVGMAPLVRKDGRIASLESNERTMSADLIRDLLTSIMPPRNREEFAARRDTDFAYEISGLARFRCNIFMDRKGMGGVFRIIPSKILTAEQLGLSKAIMDLCSLSKGLVVVTGPTGSGKSTTLAAMVDAINKQRDDHIITIEDPIEFVHENQRCLVNQREVYNHTDSFRDALRAALREDPDIVLVGEMRDLETISTAIETAETGHLVFGTLHTTTAASTVDRIIDQFPADRQQQIRVMLSESLKGVIAQTLVPKKGGGRCAALEVLIVTPAISNLIREGKTFQIPSAMQTGKAQGMELLNDSLLRLVQQGLVEARDAYIKAVDKTGFEAALTRAGHKL